MSQRLPLGSWDGVRWIRMRTSILTLGLLVGLVLVLGRAAHLQVVQQDWLGSLAKGQYARTLELSPHRGEIVDRDGATLASSVEVDSIFVDPLLLGSTWEERKDAFLLVAKAAELSAAETAQLAAKLETPGSRFFWVSRKVPPTVSSKVRALDLSGVGFVKEPKRYYPQRELAAQVLGFVGADGQGLEGIERLLDEELKGKGATVEALRDAKGRALFSETSVSSDLRTGAKVTLTLDRTIQYLTEKALSEAVRKQEAASGTAVVLDVRSGEILAIASLPTFNPNVGPTRKTRGGTRNRVLTDPFEPGSTMKVFLLAGALDRKAIRRDQTFDCENGVWRVGRHRIHDSRPYGLLTPQRILAVSSNIGTAKIAKILGAEAVEELYRDFGFGKRSGIELPGEAGGVVGPIKGDIGLATASFGQGPVMTTALQVATGFAALGNGGVLLQPRIVRSVVEQDGTVIFQGKQEVMGRSVREETAREILKWMESVVQKGGTGTLAALDGYPVAGKSGTSQKVDPGTGRYGKERIASFAGVVPSDAPRLAIVVVLDEPQKERYGGRAAAPVFREIAEGALATLGIPPSLSPSRTGEPLALPAEEDVFEGFIAMAGLEGDSPDHIRVPNLRGVGARAAILRLGDLGLEAGIEGSGRVASQRPPAGSVAEPGSKVTLTLEPP